MKKEKSMRRKTQVLLFVIILCLSAVLKGEVSYKVIDLGSLGGSWPNSVAYSVSDNGQIVGKSQASSSYPRYERATIFDPRGSGSNIDLGTLGDGWYNSCANFVNNKGQVVGYVHRYSNVDQVDYWRAAMFDPTGGGNNIDLGTLGGARSEARSINDRGQIVGNAEDGSGPGKFQATLFDPTGAGNNINLRAPDNTWSLANCINEKGQIVGWSSRYSNANMHATLFDPTGNGNNIDLGLIGGDYNRSWAYSINNLGQIVGNCGNDMGYSRATLFDPTGHGNNLNLGVLGGRWSYATSINDKGQIVGYASDSSGQYRATLFDPTGNGNNVDLNTLINPSSGWFLYQAWSINEQGWIVGSGVNSDGAHAFLLTPEPATLLLLGLGAVILRRKCS